jgi:hypothetical protein
VLGLEISFEDLGDELVDSSDSNLSQNGVLGLSDALFVSSLLVVCNGEGDVEGMA